MENFSIALVVAVCDVIDPMQPQPPFGFDNRTSYDEYKLYKAICSINPIEHKISDSAALGFFWRNFLDSFLRLVCCTGLVSCTLEQSRSKQIPEFGVHQLSSCVCDTFFGVVVFRFWSRGV